MAVVRERQLRALRSDLLAVVEQCLEPGCKGRPIAERLRHPSSNEFTMPRPTAGVSLFCGPTPMHLIHILLPLKDNSGKPLGRKLFGTVASELTEKFGGLTAHTRAPAEGLWKESSSRIDREEIVIYEVMAEELDEKWWGKYRQRLEKRFRQEKVIVQAQEVRVL